MSKFRLRIAHLFGRRLPGFGSQAEAERALLAQRDRALAALETATGQASGCFVADYTSESLKALEAWYFELHERRGFPALGTTREEFEHWMAFYYGMTASRNHPEVAWVVSEFAFEPGRYEVGVRKGLVTEMLTAAFADHYAAPSNTRRQSIWRRYRDHYV